MAGFLSGIRPVPWPDRRRFPAEQVQEVVLLALNRGHISTCSDLTASVSLSCVAMTKDCSSRNSSSGSGPLLSCRGRQKASQAYFSRVCACSGRAWRAAAAGAAAAARRTPRSGPASARRPAWPGRRQPAARAGQEQRERRAGGGGLRERGLRQVAGLPCQALHVREECWRAAVVPHQQLARTRRGRAPQGGQGPGAAAAAARWKWLAAAAGWPRSRRAAASSGKGGGRGRLPELQVQARWPPSAAAPAACRASRRRRGCPGAGARRRSCRRRGARLRSAPAPRRARGRAPAGSVPPAQHRPAWALLGAQLVAELGELLAGLRHVRLPRGSS